MYDKNYISAPSSKFFKKMFVSMNRYLKDGTDSQFLVILIVIFIVILSYPVFENMLIVKR